MQPEGTPETVTGADVEQRYQEYAYVGAGKPDQVPVEAVRTPPSKTFPETDGPTADMGMSIDCPRADTVCVTDPIPFDAVMTETT